VSTRKFDRRKKIQPSARNNGGKKSSLKKKERPRKRKKKKKGNCFNLKGIEAVFRRGGGSSSVLHLIQHDTREGNGISRQKEDKQLESGTSKLN